MRRGKVFVVLLVVGLTAAWTPDALASGRKSPEQQGGNRGQSWSEIQRAQNSSIATEFGSEQEGGAAKGKGKEGKQGAEGGRTGGVSPKTGPNGPGAK